MKTEMLSLLGLGAALALSGCSHLGYSGDKSAPPPTDPGSTPVKRAGRLQPDHAIKIKHKGEYVPDPQGDIPLPIHEWNGLWELKGKGGAGALRNMRGVKKNDSIEWQCLQNEEFSIVVTNKTEWQILNGETAVWLNGPPPFDGTVAGYVNSAVGGGRKVVELKFLSNGQTGTKGYWIAVPKIDATQAQARRIPNYENMVEATLIWDGSMHVP